jgi:inner membrane protein
MDIITHALSGVALSTVWAAFSEKPIWKKGIIICCGAIGGIFPDIDAISLWSKFDQIVKPFFHLTQTGREIYFGNYWYSHHNFMHSLFSAFLFTMIMALLFYCWERYGTKNLQLKRMILQKSTYLAAFFGGYVMHLFGDLPTPGHTWGGIKLLWPSHIPFGGTGQIWWWNNYDLFLLIIGCCTINIGFIVVSHIYKRPVIKLLPALLFFVTFGMVLYQIQHRPVNFAYNGYTKHFDEYEQKSLTIQKAILGKQLYAYMVSLDHHLKIVF